MSSGQTSTILVLLVRTNNENREEFASFVGIGKYESGGLFIDRDDGSPPIPVPFSAMSGIRPCDESMQRAFEAAEFVLSLRVQPGDTELEPFLQLDLDWHG